MKDFMPKIFAMFILLLAISMLPVEIGALEKLRYGSGVPEWPPFYLPLMAAEEKGFWKENNLDTEWIQFKGGGVELMKAVVARELGIGTNTVADTFQAAAAGVPVLLVANWHSRDTFVVWVRVDPRFKELKDLRGAVFGVGRLGSITHIYGRAVAKALGIEKDIRHVGTGGIREGLAALRTGAIDVNINPLDLLIKLKYEGVVKQMAVVADFLPKDWIMVAVFARKDFLKDNKDIIGRAVKAVLRATNFVSENPRWAIDKMKSVSGFSEDAAEEVYKGYQFTKDGKITKEAVANVRSFLIEYGLISKEKTPPVEDLYTTEVVK